MAASWRPPFRVRKGNRSPSHSDGPKRFVLAASGHIAGVVNPPEGGKYSHWINAALPPDPDAWFKTPRRSRRDPRRAIRSL